MRVGGAYRRVGGVIQRGGGAILDPTAQIGRHCYVWGGGEGRGLCHWILRDPSPKMNPIKTPYTNPCPMETP